MARKKERRNILDLIPVRSYEWEEKGKVIVKVPRFRSRLGRRFCRLIKKKQTYDVNLDKLGSEAWKMCDGKRTVREIARALKEKFGDEIHPVHERLGEFLNIMESNRLITYKSMNNVSADAKGADNGAD